MTHRWNVTVGGRERQVSVDHGESGKDVIKVDGRTVARPLTPQEQERIFAIEGVQYAVRRAEGGFTIDLLSEPAPEAAPPPQGGRVPSPGELPADAHAAALGVPSFNFSNLYRFWWVGVVIAVALLMYMLVPSYPDDAAKRVMDILQDLKAGVDAESHLSTTLWARNVRNMDQMELNAAVNQFTAWRREKDFFYEKGFTNYKIIESEEIEGEVPTARVTFEIEGDRYTVIVPERRPIRWAD
jgi:hypothetical protein